MLAKLYQLTTPIDVRFANIFDALASSSTRSRSTRSGVQINLEPDIYDIIEADNTAMERVARAKTRKTTPETGGTPTYSGNNSSLGRSLSRGILKRGKGSRRPGSDTVRSRAGFSDVKSVSRYVRGTR